jgi:hypothetical protein
LESLESDVRLGKPRGEFAVPHVGAARDDRSVTYCVSACSIFRALQLLEDLYCLRINLVLPGSARDPILAFAGGPERLLRRLDRRSAVSIA